MHRLLVKHAKQVVTVCKNGETLLKGAAMNDVSILDGPINIVVDENGNIDYIGEDDDISQKFGDAEFERVLDASGMCVVPGSHCGSVPCPFLASLDCAGCTF